MKYSTLVKIGGIFSGIGYGFLIKAKMKQLNCNHQDAAILAANGLIKTCQARILDSLMGNVELKDESDPAFNAGYFEDGE